MKHKCEWFEKFDDGFKCNCFCTAIAVVNLEGTWYCAEHETKHKPGLPNIEDAHPDPGSSLLLDVATVILFNHNAHEDELSGMLMHNSDADRDRREYAEAIKRIRAAVEKRRNG